MKVLAISILAAAIAGPAGAQAVAGFGEVAPVEGAHERPDPARSYRVVFDISNGPAAPGQPAPGLERVARFVNMLAAGGVPSSRRELVAVLHGPATEAVLTDAAYGRRHAGAKNPNTPLIAALKAAGVDVRVCGQALAAQKIPAADVLTQVQVDLAALLTVTHKQLEGYALVVS